LAVDEHRAAGLAPAGAEIIGGAETATRMLAEALVRLGRAEVEVLTTTALSMDSWANHFPAGTDTLGGVTVRRFAVTLSRASP
jgi:hypothetical protein